jgi:hypothetical protein
MQMKKIKEIAKKRISRHGKTDLIRAIQRAEGNIDFAAIHADECEQLNCLWREDCAVKVIAA